ncbi:MAG: dipeptidase [Anaerolineales bacterium]|nr:dipeptidase [Anaerolineales bacterium]MCW5854764.1 dipeptidase [Anaerolineales bacterium]
MSDPRNAALKYSQDNRARTLEELKELVAIPSVSADPAYKADILRAADWVVSKLKALGFQNVKTLDTGGHPMVYGDLMNAGEGAPTMLIYGHYDVQPADPMELWETPAFEGVQKGDLLFGRGASDMKGQVIASIAAVEAALHAGKVPVNIKWMIEGEEETGSPTMAQFIQEHADLFAADFALNPDAGMLTPTQPTITYGLRGMSYFELHITGPTLDLHSGFFGGTVRNPANELARVLGSMQDADGRVTIPGFYDKVRELEEAERADFRRLPQDDSFYLQQSGSKALWGDKDFSAYERATAQPTLDINGLLSGYTSEGPKTVLPAKAMAKFSCRLVPDQDPFEIDALVRKYIEDTIDPSVSWELKLLSDAIPSISERDSAAVQAMAKAQETVWGVRPIFRREGGSVPVVGHLQGLGIESINVGSGLPDDQLHSPNERLHLPTWEKEIDAMIHFIYNLGE